MSNSASLPAKISSDTDIKIEKSFASGLNFYKLFWVFMVGCFLGVVLETIWWFITTGKIESRVGLVYGPFNTVYGFGATLMTLSLNKLTKKRDLLIFASSALIGAAFEYICSLWQELSLGTVSWEYSNTPFNLQGRINIMFSFMWGILGLIWIKDLYPRVSRMIERIPNKIGRPLTVFLTIFMIINIVMSVGACKRQSERRAGIPPRGITDEIFDSRFPDERLQKIFPNMMPTDE